MLASMTILVICAHVALRLSNVKNIAVCVASPDRKNGRLVRANDQVGLLLLANIKQKYLHCQKVSVYAHEKALLVCSQVDEEQHTLLPGYHFLQLYSYIVCSSLTSIAVKKRILNNVWLKCDRIMLSESVMFTMRSLSSIKILAEILSPCKIAETLIRLHITAIEYGNIYLYTAQYHSVGMSLSLVIFHSPQHL